jgi:quinoprotein glucose dehydrogenase
MRRFPTLLVFLILGAVPALAWVTYLWKGEQYVAIGAGGHSESGTSIGDSLVAFRLARPGEAPSLWSRTIDRPGGRFWARAILFALTIGLLAIAVWRWRRARRRRAIAG